MVDVPDVPPPLFFVVSVTLIVPPAPPVAGAPTAVTVRSVPIVTTPVCIKFPWLERRAGVLKLYGMIDYEQCRIITCLVQGGQAVPAGP